MKSKMLIAATLLCLMGCDESPKPLPRIAQLKAFRYHITQYIGAYGSNSYFVNEWSYEGDGWISLVNPETNLKIWLSGNICVEEGSFKGPR